MRLAFKIFLFFLPLSGIAVPMPGVWNSGGTGSYSLLNSFDTSFYRRVQIEKELILVQLHPGFAVVKGIYWMRNSSSDTVRMKAGFPAGQSYSVLHNGLRHARVDFDTLYKLEVLSDGNSCRIKRDTLEDPFFAGQYDKNSYSHWLTWENTFLPASLVKIEIYTLINTNDSEMGDGWSENDDNVFVYLPNSQFWKTPVSERTLIVQLMEGLDPGEIRGIAPDSLFQLDKNKNILYHHSTNFTSGLAIVIAYGHRINRFNFESIADSSEAYFKAIVQLEAISGSHLSLASFDHGDPYSFDSVVDDPVLQFFFVILLIIGLVIATIVIAVIRAQKQSRRQLPQ